MIPPTTHQSNVLGNGSVESNSHGDRRALAPLPPALPAQALDDWGMDQGDLFGAKPAQSFNFLEILHALRRRWALAASLSFFSFIVVAGLLYFLIPLQQTATAFFRVRALAPSIREDRTTMHMNDATVRRIQATEQAQAKNPAVLDAMLRSPRFTEISTVTRQGDQARYLNEELRVSFVNNSEIMAFSISGENSQDIENIVNRWVEVYQEVIVRKEDQLKRNRYDTLKDAYTERSRELTAARKQLRKNLEDVGVGSLEERRLRTQVETQALRDLANSKSIAKQKLDEAREQWQAAKSQIDLFIRTPISDVMVDEAVSRDPEYQRLMAMSMQARNVYELQRGPAGGTREIPSVRQMRLSAEHAQAAVEKYRSDVKSKLRRQRRGMAGQGQLKFIESRLVARQNDYKSAIEAYDAAVTKLTSQGKLTIDMEEKALLIDQLASQVSELAKQLSVAELEEKAGSRVELLQPATVPKTAEVLQKWILVIGSGVLAAIVATGGVGGWEFSKRRLNSVDETTKKMGIPLVGTLPALSAHGPFSESASKLEAMLSDSIDSIRTSLIHGSHGPGRRSVVVTSAWDGEGKTTVASQLAASLARCGRRTVLIDGDLRNPTLHELFGMANDHGVCEVLRGENDLEDVLHATPAEGLKLLSAGRCDYTAIQGLETERLGRLFDQLKAQFDFIIVDAPPVLGFADAMLFGQYVDGAVLSTRIDVSRRGRIETARDRLRTVGIPLLGTVVNGVRSASSHRTRELAAVEG